MKRILLIVVPLAAFAMQKEVSSAKELLEIAKEQFESIPRNPDGLSHDELISRYKEMRSLFNLFIQFADPDSPISRKAAYHFDGIKE